MMKVNLIFEGPTDIDFFNPLLNLFGGTFYEVIEPRRGDGKYKAQDILKTYIRARFSKIGYAQDIDQGTSQTCIEKTKEKLISEGLDVQTEDPWLAVNNSKVLLIPMGLHGDDLLKKFGVNRFAQEDYLLKIFLLNLKSKEKLKRALTSKRRKDIALDRSKDILKLAVEMNVLEKDYHSKLIETINSRFLNVFNPVKEKLEILKDP